MRKRYRRKNRSVSLLHAHLVFCSKFRRKVFTPPVFAALRASMEATARDLGVDIIAIEADRDHVHLMAAFPPKLALSDLVRRMKGASSRAIRAKRFPEVLRTLWGKYFWSPYYFVVLRLATLHWSLASAARTASDHAAAHHSKWSNATSKPKTPHTDAPSAAPTHYATLPTTPPS